MKILLTSSFKKKYKKLPIEVQKKFKEKIKFLLENKQHPSLRLHELKGKLKGQFSISINYSYRAVYRQIDSDEESIIEFINIGTHSIYK